MDGRSSRDFITDRTFLDYPLILPVAD